jgi:hypothetical protein
LAIAGVVLAVGALLYLARPVDPAAIGWIDHAGFATIAGAARGLRALVWAHVDLPAWFRGSASDAAFAFALGAILADAPLVLVGVGAAVVLGHEIAQGLGLAAGTFDLRDLFVLALSYSIAQIIFRRTSK